MYKARDLDEQGVNERLIARVGRWLRNALITSYLKFFSPEALLAAGDWDRASFDSFFAEHFCIDVPEELVAYVFPFLATLTKQVEDMGGKAEQSARAIPEVLSYLGEVVVQDACALLSSSNPEVRAAAEANAVHKYLLANAGFRQLLADHEAKLAAGGCEPLRTDRKSVV